MPDVPLLDALGNPVPGEPPKAPFDPWNSWTVQSDWDVVGTVPNVPDVAPAAIQTTVSADAAPGEAPPAPLEV